MRKLLQEGLTRAAHLGRRHLNYIIRHSLQKYASTVKNKKLLTFTGVLIAKDEIKKAPSFKLCQNT